MPLPASASCRRTTSSSEGESRDRLAGTLRLSACPIPPRPSSGGPTRLAQINSRIRLVRLRPEYAHLYPGLDPGVWETATELASRLLAQHALQPSPGFMLSNRILPDEHFEFQGGTPGGFWNGRRMRQTD